jgi:hypothetical protein
MIEDIVSLNEKFKNIKNKGWVKSLRKGTTGIGYTFETLLGKEEESFPIPDYGSIEIKTRYRNAKFPITLFNATPDGDYLFPMKRLYDRFAFPQSSNRRFRVFYAGMVATKYTRAGRNYQFKLIVDRDKEIIKVIAYSKATGIIDPNVSWSFNFLKEKIERKLKYLALVKADAQNSFDLQYYKYYDIRFYMLRGFNTFLSLIEDGTINITFALGCYKSGNKIGQMDNHGSNFEIDENNLEKLFVKVC